MKIKCPYCKNEELELVPAVEPWHDEYYICPTCDSTYNKDEIASQLHTTVV